MTRMQFRALLDLYMKADNMLTPEQDLALLGLLETTAHSYGHASWVDAYHTFKVNE